MREKFKALAVAAGLIVLICGCASPTDHNAIRLAVSQSNLEADRLYHVTPFTSDDGKLRMEGHNWVWDAKTTSNGHDIVSKVTFDRNATVSTVDVRMEN